MEGREREDEEEKPQEGDEERGEIFGLKRMEQEERGKKERGKTRRK